MKTYIAILVLFSAFLAVVSGFCLLRVAHATSTYGTSGFVPLVYGLVLCSIGISICIAKLSYTAGKKSK